MATLQTTTKSFNSKIKVSIVPKSVGKISPIQNYSFDSQPVATEEIEKETHDNIHTDENREVPTGSLITTATKTSRLKVIVVVSAIIFLLLLTILLPIVLITLLRNNTANSSVTNEKSSVCSTSCIGYETSYTSSDVTAIFPFEGNYNDLTGSYTGIGRGASSPPFGSTTCWIGDCIEIRNGVYEYVMINGFDLKDRSFTIEFWFIIRGASTAIDCGLFSQCDTNSVCLSISVRNGRLAISFDSLNSSANIFLGSTITAKSYWYHVSLVYDLDLRQQRLYINGLIDDISRNVDPYKGSTSGSQATVGLSSSSNYPSSVMNGFLDHLVVYAGTARSRCQINNDANLFVYYPFDRHNTWSDHSLNVIHGHARNMTKLEYGRIGQAVSFNSTISFFRALAFPTNRPSPLPFSITLWVKPYAVINGGSLLHVSASSNGGGTPCYDMLGFTATGVLIAQISTGASTVASVTGPILPLDTWTHITLLYSISNGFRLLIDGQFINSVSASITNNNVNFYITLGSNNPGMTPVSPVCSVSSIVAGQFLGEIDEFRVYTRELNAQEICRLMDVR